MIILSVDQALQLYKFLSHQYISHEDYPAFYELLKELENLYEKN